MFVHVLFILGASVAIYFLGERFATASSRIGDYFRLPKSVKGATLDAISSSLPELLIAVFSVIFFERFDVGVATIAGSAAFNLLIIPALCVFFAPKTLSIAKEVISRDGFYYVLSVILLMAAVWYSPVWGVFIPLVFLALYGLYLTRFVAHTKRHKVTAKSVKTRLTRDISVVLLTGGLIAVASYVLVEHAILFANVIGAHPVIIGFTVIAVATSVPDAVVSVANARKGSGDDAISNALGSNTFDILVGLSLPVLLYIFLFRERVVILFDNFEILFGLLVATLIVLYFIARNNALQKKEGLMLVGMYLLFLVYVVALSFMTPAT